MEHSERLIGEDTVEDSTAWRHAANAILGGICHELNGRIGAVSGLVQLARLDGALDEQTGDLLESEVARLERLSRLLEMLRADRSPESEPLRPSTLVPPALELFRRHRGLEGIDVEVEVSDVVPVVGRPVSLVKALVTLLAAAGQAARRGGVARIRLCSREEADGVVLVAEPLMEAREGAGPRPAESESDVTAAEMPHRSGPRAAHTLGFALRLQALSGGAPSH